MKLVLNELFTQGPPMKGPSVSLISIKSHDANTILKEEIERRGCVKWTNVSLKENISHPC